MLSALELLYTSSKHIAIGKPLLEMDRKFNSRLPQKPIVEKVVNIYPTALRLHTMLDKSRQYAQNGIEDVATYSNL